MSNMYFKQEKGAHTISGSVTTVSAYRSTLRVTDLGIVVILATRINAQVTYMIKIFIK